jgi:hypothetical protein
MRGAAPPIEIPNVRSPDVGPFISDQHPQSRRHAILEDDGRTGWLYLTAPDELRPIADVWVYNRASPADHVDRTDRSRPPPIVKRFAGSGAVVREPERSGWHLRWSVDGETVALERDGAVAALITSGRKRGYSANVLSDSPWGSLLTADVFTAVRW